MLIYVVVCGTVLGCYSDSETNSEFVGVSALRGHQRHHAQLAGPVARGAWKSTLYGFGLLSGRRQNVRSGKLEQEMKWLHPSICTKRSRVYI